PSCARPRWRSMPGHNRADGPADGRPADADRASANPPRATPAPPPRRRAAGGGGGRGAALSRRLLPRLRFARFLEPRLCDPRLLQGAASVVLLPVLLLRLRVSPRLLARALLRLSLSLRLLRLRLPVRLR